MTLQVLVVGMAAGYAMALLSTAALTYLLHEGIGAGRLDRWIDRGVPRALVAVQVLFASTAAWMLAGTALAALYLGAEFDSGRDGIGSRSLPFTGVMASLAAAPLPPLVYLFPRRWWLWSAMSAAFLVLFGWILPLAGG